MKNNIFTFYCLFLDYKRLLQWMPKVISYLPMLKFNKWMQKCHQPPMKYVLLFNQNCWKLYSLWGLKRLKKVLPQPTSDVSFCFLTTHEICFSFLRMGGQWLTCIVFLAIQGRVIAWVIWASLTQIIALFSRTLKPIPSSNPYEVLIARGIKFDF